MRGKMIRTGPGDAEVKEKGLRTGLGAIPFNGKSVI
jgi:hypothetical protein